MTKNTAFPTSAEKFLTTHEAYLSMLVFLEAFWERDGKPADSIAKLLSWMQPMRANGEPADPAMWSDWVNAITKARLKTE